MLTMDSFTQYVVPPKKRISLEDFSSDPDNELSAGKSESKKELAELTERLADLQQRFFVDRRRRFLIILQGLDTSGKNGTIKHVFRAVNPQGVHVASFDKPSTRELSHDYMWRVHQQAPRLGEIMIFDRSHYEDVLAVRVNHLKPQAVWQKRYRHIREFERMLCDEDTTVLKFFLHIDRNTQRKRLQHRLDIPEKNWKFDTSDLVARSKWNDYIKAYEDVFYETSSPKAPWFIIPSNKKWARNLIVARIMVSYLDQMHLSYPKVDFDPNSIHIPI